MAEGVRANQLKLSSELRERFDYIVIGAGTSGSVVAGRLASDPNTQVLLLEAGGSDETELITNPIRITEAGTEQYTCSPLQTLNRLRSLSSKLRNR